MTEQGRGQDSKIKDTKVGNIVSVNHIEGLITVALRIIIVAGRGINHTTKTIDNGADMDINRGDILRGGGKVSQLL